MTNEASGPTFKQWLRDCGKSEKTASNYAQTIKGSVSEWAIENSICEQPLLDYRGAKPVSRIVREIRELDIFKLRNDRGKGMYNAALNWFEEYTVERLDDSIAADIEAVVSDQDIPETERSTIIAARVGHGKFRQDVIKYWGEKCCATGYAQISMLIASHIKPWKRANNQERLDPYNGLLLLPNLDKAFDRKFISFRSDGRILISRELEEPARLSVHPGIRIRIGEAHARYMEFHRDQCFRG